MYLYVILFYLPHNRILKYQGNAHMDFDPVLRSELPDVAYFLIAMADKSRIFRSSHTFLRIFRCQKQQVGVCAVVKAT